MVVTTAAALIALPALLPGPTESRPPVVRAAAATEPMAEADDAADDAAVWVCASDPSRSLIIGTNKRRGLVVYALDGRVVQELADGRMNNVDVVRGVLGADGARMDLVLATDRTANGVAAYAVDARTGRLSALPGSPLCAGGPEEVYGLCAWVDHGGHAHATVVHKCGKVRVLGVEQDSSHGAWSARVVREFHIGSQGEGCVADAWHGWLYIGEEAVGVWRYPLAGDGPRELLDTVWPRLGGRLARDVEGVTIYDAGDGRGWVIVSCQAENRFAAYDRATGAYAGSFSIEHAGAEGMIDPVTHTDGIAAISADLGPRFPRGVFIAQDDNDGRDQNFKIVDWREIERHLTPHAAADAATGR